jgi:hypothetical protein
VYSIIYDAVKEVNGFLFNPVLGFHHKPPWQLEQAVA